MTHLALDSARNEYYTSACGARPNAAKLAVVVTDGMSTFPESTEAAAPALHATGVKVVSIGIGSGVSQDELKIIASSVDLVFSANNFDVLDAIEKEVSATACEAATSLPGYLEGCAGSCSSNLLCMAKNGE
ncbi:collagen alpha-1(XII) chain, partial [Aplysia californica]|uniref:Collagen alpha-1(XII) chain n=1 Tax=Aplysia californica TaxID=6500 RepID=A0ABM1A0Y7_APLCA